jgi:aromatic-L-amino-acid/L-tryptophan decarboxylase
MSSSSDTIVTSVHSMSADTFRQLGYAVVDLAARHLTHLPGQPVWRPLPQEVREEIRQQPFPLTGTSPEALLALYERLLLPYTGGNRHPRFFAWIAPPGAEMAAFAQWLAALQNTNCGVGDHTAAELERCVLDWMKEIIGYPIAQSKGILTSGGTEGMKTGMGTVLGCTLRWLGE